MNLNMRRVINHSYSNKIDEVTRKNLVGKNKAQSPDRFKRKSSYHALSYNGIHLKELLERDLLVVEVPVGDYTCTLAYTGVLSELNTVLKSQPRPNVTLQSVIRALQRSIDNTDVLVDCTCADFCLHEDTQIKLLNGKVVSIKEMKSMFDNNEELWVYSTDNNGDFKPGKVSNVWISGTTTEYIEVTLDNDKIIKTTPNHLYMLRDGSYIRADELEQNMSLMPLYFSYHNGYENVKLNSIKDKTIFKSVYKIVSDEELAEQISIAKERSFDLSLYSHKVKSINRISLDSPEFVYDLEVDNYHNFYVDAGVMLHNCYRFAYYATKYGYKYGTPETRPPEKTNPKDNLGATCKHLSALLYSKRWLVKLATSLNNLIKQYTDDFRRAMKLQPNEFIINSSGRPSAKTGRNTGMLSNADNTDISNTNDSVAANNDSIVDNAGGDEI